ncbi:3-dehydroquinate synthase [Clostridium sp. D2Q-14]|uniref:3-dehydroquinate synthase n=1 Tax=Anaeromonas gelatinilytica TaxID=2683194 RepID=UPI00193B0880|nr:3-dehydroquinate synthase [Anaeromonas gelatinilytica]MBS4535440.1 3-dehydroquinate synthase [Anaeromonas gelatinilytica]
MKLNIRTKSENYVVYIKRDLLNDLSNYIKEYKKEKILIITDENVANIYINEIKKTLKDFKIDFHIISPGEKSKSLNTSKDIYDKLLYGKYNRRSLIISLGGGVIGDLAGFVASTYMRGIDFIQIPTTLLSQVDSSVGGKVGINYNNIKNIIGSFYQPKKVLIDPETLKTLDLKNLKSGLSEVIKYGIIRDYDFFKMLKMEIDIIKSLNIDKMENIIKKSLEIKEEIVYLDTYENDIRKILNFGHTIGHGIESLNDFQRFTHGEAIALGMISEAYISRELGYISSDYYCEIKYLLNKIISDVKFTREEKQEIIKNLENDKKNTNKDIVFILPINRGEVRIFYKGIDRSLIIKSLGADR